MARAKVILVDADVIAHFIATGHIMELNGKSKLKFSVDYIQYSVYFCYPSNSFFHTVHPFCISQNICYFVTTQLYHISLFYAN